MIQIEIERVIITALGFSMKAGKLAFGTDQVCDSCRYGKSRIALMSNDCSENTKKRIVNCFDYYNKRLYELNISSSELGKIIGKNKTACVAILDDNFANMIDKTLNK